MEALIYIGAAIAILVVFEEKELLTRFAKARLSESISRLACQHGGFQGRE